MSGKKESRCDRKAPSDAGRGSQWDHAVFAVESRLLVSLVVGPRTSKQSRALWKDFARRTDGVLPALITTDEYRAYRGALLQVYGVQEDPPWPPGRRGQRVSRRGPPRGLVYAMVHKRRRRGRVIKISIRRVFGNPAGLSRALRQSEASTHVNTAFLERYNATTRQHNSRKARRVYTFSKEFLPHEAMSWFAAAYYNFCRCHRGLRQKIKKHWRSRTPAMGAGLTDQPWSLAQFLAYPMPPPLFGLHVF